MSMRYKGAVLSTTAPTVTQQSAQGIWSLSQQAQYQLASNWPSAFWNNFLSSASSADSISTGVSTDSAGNLYFSGRIVSSGAAIAGKVNSFGVVQWARTLLSSAGASSGTAVTVDSSGNVYTVGYMTVTGGTAIFFAKYDSTGTLQWQNKVNVGTGANAGYGIQVDSSGNVYVSGNTFGTPNTVFLAKYNSSGTFQGSSNLLGASNSLSYSLKIAPSGNIYSGGVETVSANANALLLKYNSSLTLQWQKKLTPSTYGTRINDIAIDSAENIYVCGDHASSTDSFIAAYSTSGALLWQRNLNQATSISLQGIAVDTLGNIFVSGYGGSGGLYIVKYSASGAIIWQRTISGSNATIGILSKIAVDPFGNVIYGLDSLPNDGSKTGTYLVGSNTFTYSASALTDSAGSLTDATGTLTVTSPTIVNAAAGMTAASYTLTTTVLPI